MGMAMASRASMVSSLPFLPATKNKVVLDDSRHGRSEATEEIMN
jgi:hypothetical protein